MTLKTLKDIDFEQVTDVKPDGYEGNAPGRKRIVKRKIVFCYTLKQEAIKWIKEYKNKKHPKHLIKKDKEAQAFSEGLQKGIINWIKRFFNITEEDLK